jgi:hypothetical protein
MNSALKGSIISVSFIPSSIPSFLTIP